MTRRRGRYLPYALSSRMPITMPNPSGRTMTAKSFAASPRVCSGEVRSEHAEDADERGGDPEVQQRPADRAVGADERRCPRAAGTDGSHRLRAAAGHARPSTSRSAAAATAGA